MRVLIAPFDVEQRAAYARAADDLRQRRRGVMVTTVHGTGAAHVRAEWFPSGEASADAEEPTAAAICAAGASS